MENKPKAEHVKLRIFSIVIALIICVIGISFAYFELTKPTNKKNINVSSGSLDVTFNTTSSINDSNAELDEVSQNTFTVTNNSNRSMDYDINLVSINLDSKLRNSDFKWELLNGTTSVGSGTGTDINDKSSIKLNTSTQSLDSTESASYTFKVWLANNASSDQSGLYEGSFESNIQVVAKSK